MGHGPDTNRPGRSVHGKALRRFALQCVTDGVLPTSGPTVGTVIATVNELRERAFCPGPFLLVARTGPETLTAAGAEGEDL